MDLTGRSIGICAKGRPWGTVQKKVKFTIKSYRILRGVQIWIFFCIRVVENKSASRAQDVDPSIVEFILKILRISSSNQW
jgi:hypothetical protein